MTLRDSTTGGFVSAGRERGRAALSSSVVGRILLDVLDVGRRSLSSSTTGLWLRRLGHQTRVTARDSRTGNAVRWVGRAVRKSWLYRWLTTEPEVDVVVIDLRETMFVGPVLAVLNRVFGPGARHWRDSATGRAVTHLSERFVARPIRTTGVAVLVAAIASLLFLIGLGSPSQGAVGVALLVAALALAGTRVQASLNDLTETRAFDLAVTLLAPPEAPEDPDPDSGTGAVPDPDSDPDDRPAK